jgi:hypothetical protein
MAFHPAGRFTHAQDVRPSEILLDIADFAVGVLFECRLLTRTDQCRPNVAQYFGSGVDLSLKVGPCKIGVEKFLQCRLIRRVDRLNEGMISLEHGRTWN